MFHSKRHSYGKEQQWRIPDYTLWAASSPPTIISPVKAQSRVKGFIPFAKWLLINQRKYVYMEKKKKDTSESLSTIKEVEKGNNVH